MVKRLRIFNNFNIPKKYKKSIILIGNFDGLHSGHQKLFELAKKYKAKYARNPKTNEKVYVPEKKIVKFKSSSKWAKLINNEE